jgi:hypothetical protein
MWDQVSHPYKTTGRIMVLCVCVCVYCMKRIGWIIFCRSTKYFQNITLPVYKDYLTVSCHYSDIILTCINSWRRHGHKISLKQGA